MLKKEQKKIIMKIKKELKEHLFYLKKYKYINFEKIKCPINKKSLSQYINVYFFEKEIPFFEIRISEHERSFRNEADYNLIINNFDFEKLKIESIFNDFINLKFEELEQAINEYKKGYEE